MAPLRFALRGAAGLVFLGCFIAPAAAPLQSVRHSVTAACNIATASPWIARWFAAWQLTSEKILRIPNIPPPDVVFYDADCVYTTSAVTAATPPVPGPALLDTKLFWRAVRHNDTLTTPKGARLPVQLMSFADFDKRTGRPFFVMAAPDYWFGSTGQDELLFTAVFLHEFTHVRQVRGLASIIGPIDDTWEARFGEELDDNAVQRHFQSDSAYAAAYMTERDLLYRAAEAESLADVRALAKQALAMIRARHARWFTGDNAVFSVLDDTWLSMEGAAQWVAYAWLAHPSGGRLSKLTALAKIGRRRHWSQDEGLGLFLVVDRLMPDWPSLVFNEPSMGAIALLDRAVQR